MAARWHSEGTFPVVHSLLSPAALGDAVAGAFGLADVRCTLIKATSRDVYRVESSDGLRVLIVYRHGRRSVSEILAELDLLDQLEGVADGLGMAVAPSLPLLDGHRILTLPAPEGPRSAVLFRFAEGRPLDRVLDATVAHRVGQLVARLHRLADTEVRVSAHWQTRPALDADLLVERPLALIERLLGPSPDELDALKQIAGRIRQQLTTLPRTSPGYGLIHGDIIPQNMLVTQDGTLTLLDFDFCGPGWRAFDVATFLHHRREHQPATGEDDGVGDAFLAGYQSARPLLDWERLALPVFVAARALFRLGNWGPRLAEWGASVKPDGLVARQLAMMRSELAQAR